MFWNKKVKSTPEIITQIARDFSDKTARVESIIGKANKNQSKTTFFSVVEIIAEELNDARMSYEGLRDLPGKASFFLLDGYCVSLLDVWEQLKKTLVEMQSNNDSEIKEQIKGLIGKIEEIIEDIYKCKPQEEFESLSKILEKSTNEDRA